MLEALASQASAPRRATNGSLGHAGASLLAFSRRASAFHGCPLVRGVHPFRGIKSRRSRRPQRLRPPARRDDRSDRCRTVVQHAIFAALNAGADPPDSRHRHDRLPELRRARPGVRWAGDRMPKLSLKTTPI